MLVASEKLDLNNSLDNQMFNHIAYVSNSVLFNLREHGLAGESLEQSGKMLWRLYNVLGAYNAKKRKVSLTNIISIVEEFRSVFG